MRKSLELVSLIALGVPVRITFSVGAARLSRRDLL